MIAAAPNPSLIRLPYRPRPLQSDLHARMQRFNVLVCHRRFGKTQMAKLRNSTPVQLPAVSDVHGRVRVFNETVTLASQTTSDTIEIASLPKGARVLYGVLTTDTSLGSSTVAIGIAGTTGKYRAAATFTAANTPTLFGVTAGIGNGLANDEIVFITIAAATMPSSGTLRVMIFYSLD